MSIKAEIIADSINPKGCRLTTFLLEFPRFVLAELATHRMFSKNAASSRAIPIEKMIQQVIDNPAMPVWWGKSQSGMQAKEELNDSIKTFYDPYLNDGIAMTEKELAKRLWLRARDEAINRVTELNKLGLHKQIANRILEPWFNIRIILSGTEFENFFALRAHPDAQPEIQALAYKMLEEYNKSAPKKLEAGEWHIPFGDKIDYTRLAVLGITQTPDYDEKYDMSENEGQQAWLDEWIDEAKRKIAIARCARISYLNYEGNDDYTADIKLCDRLFGNIPRHLSPAEHVAQAVNDDIFIGNFRGWRQYRKFFEGENLSDSRVKRL